MAQRTDQEYKENTASHWSKDPCGIGDVDGKPGDGREYYERLRKSRYAEDEHGWLLKLIRELDVKDKDVLEIGYGQGTDHLEMACMGGRMHGISITPRDKEIVDERFALYGMSTDAVVGDAENMPYDDESFDFVYSFGVLHHCPNMEKAVKESCRVLKKGGKGLIGVYHRDSMFFWWTIMLWDMALHAGFRKYSIKERLSLLEYPNDDKGLVVRILSKRKFRKMLARGGTA